jgi:hypothetical protein
MGGTFTETIVEALRAQWGIGLHPTAPPDVAPVAPVSPIAGPGRVAQSGDGDGQVVRWSGLKGQKPQLKERP